MVPPAEFFDLRGRSLKKDIHNLIITCLPIRPDLAESAILYFESVDSKSAACPPSQPPQNSLFLGI